MTTSLLAPAFPRPENAFSISSTHSTHGAIASERFSARRMFASDSPTNFPMTLPMSSRINGISNDAAVTFAHRDLPQPGIPTMSTPFGMSTPNSVAFLMFLKTFAFRSSQSCNVARPPMSSFFSRTSTISRMPDFWIICRFCSRISARSSRLISPLLERASARMLPISNSESPLKACTMSLSNCSSNSPCQCSVCLPSSPASSSAFSQ